MSSDNKFSEHEIKTALENTTAVFRFVERPLLIYISKILDISLDKIVTPIPPHADTRFNVCGNIYLLELVTQHRNIPMNIPWNDNNPKIQPLSKKIKEYIGFIILVIKNTGYSTIINDNNTSSIVKTQLTGTHIKFNPEMSNLEIVFDIDDQPYNENNDLALGFRFIPTN